MDGPAGRLRQADDNIADMFVDGANETAIRESLSARPSFAGTADLALGGLGDSAGALPFLEARGVDAGWNRALREDEIQLLGDDPYALFRPRLRFHFVPASSGPDTTAPTVSSVTVPSAGDEITVQMSEDVTTGSGGSGGWTCSLSGVTVTAAIDGVDASIVRLTPSRTIAQGENFTVGYTQPGDGLQDADGNLVQTLSGQVVSNNSLQSGHSEVYMPIQPTTTTPSFTAPPAARDGKRRSWMSEAEPAWTLPTGHYLSELYPFTVVAPRPASEITGTSIYNTYVPGERYEVPLLCLGGSFPYKFELLEGPPGTTIVGEYSHANRADYGKLSVPSMSEGNHSFRVRVYDQNLNTAVMAWTVNVAASNGIWVDASNSGSATRDGSQADPWASWDEAYEGTQDPVSTSYSTVYGGDKVMILKAGTYTPTLPSGSSAAFQLGPNKPRVIVGDPNAAPGAVQISLVNGWLSWNQAATPDAYVSHVTLDGNLTTNANPRMLWFTGPGRADRQGVYEIILQNYTGGTVNGDNNDGLAWFSNTTTDFKKHCFACRVGYDGFSMSTTTKNGYIIKVSGLEDSLVQGVYRAGPGSVDVPPVGSKYFHNGRMVMRLIEETDPVGNYQIINAGIANNGDAEAPIDVEYCVVTRWSNTQRSGGICLAMSNPIETHGSLSVRRCTLYGGGDVNLNVEGSDGTTLYLDGNVYQGASTYARVAMSGEFLVDADNHLTGASGIVDADGLLTGASRAAHLGTKGWEIA